MFEVQKQSLLVDEYMEIYSSVGWKLWSKEQISAALANSTFTVCVKENGKPIGMGRFVGDGIYCDIKDLAVLPSYQGKGVGKLIMDTIIEHISESTPKEHNVCVQLISTENKEGFYEKYGFGKKPGDGMGHGMMALITGRK